jgi:hypothetical protein
MKIVWMGAFLVAASPAFAQTTIYKHVDEGGRVTYSNKPMKGATVMELDPLTTIPATPSVRMQKASLGPERSEARDGQPGVAVLTPVPSTRPSLAAIEPQVQKRRDDDRRRILEQELTQEEQSLGEARNALSQEQQNPLLIAAVRVAQQAADPTPSQLAEFRATIDKASGRIRGLQSSVAEHEKNVEALKKELGSLKP